MRVVLLRVAVLISILLLFTVKDTSAQTCTVDWFTDNIDDCRENDCSECIIICSGEETRACANQEWNCPTGVDNITFSVSDTNEKELFKNLNLDCSEAKFLTFTVKDGEKSFQGSEITGPNNGDFLMRVEQGQGLFDMTVECNECANVRFELISVGEFEKMFRRNTILAQNARKLELVTLKNDNNQGLIRFDRDSQIYCPQSGSRSGESNLPDNRCVLNFTEAYIPEDDDKLVVYADDGITDSVIIVCDDSYDQSCANIQVNCEKIGSTGSMCDFQYDGLVWRCGTDAQQDSGDSCETRSFSPSMSPTLSTMEPTRFPTVQSANPTISPTTTFQTMYPTRTRHPTVSPTLSTSEPSFSPTIGTSSPTRSTNSPTSVTSNPTLMTRQPTAVTGAPTTVTSNPTLGTAMPSNSPVIPTDSPTGVPSSTPSGYPSKAPTMIPTRFPTIHSTGSPTSSPAKVTSNPTESPTKDGQDQLSGSGGGSDGDTLLILIIAGVSVCAAAAMCFGGYSYWRGKKMMRESEEMKKSLDKPSHMIGKVDSMTGDMPFDVDLEGDVSRPTDNTSLFINTNEEGNLDETNETGVSVSPAPSPRVAPLPPPKETLKKKTPKGTPASRTPGLGRTIVTPKQRQTPGKTPGMSRKETEDELYDPGEVTAGETPQMRVNRSQSEDLYDSGDAETAGKDDTDL